MGNFTLRLLSDGIPDAGVARQTAVNEAKAFQQEYLSLHPEKSGDRKLNDLFHDLGRGRFWCVLYAIDGCDNPLAKESEAERMQARAWARQNFTDAELQKLLDISANMALRVPFETAWPGTYKGHSILYRELQKPDSMFYGIVDESLRRRFNNGRFWEELPGMLSTLNYGAAYKVVNDVLVHNFGDIDIGFAPRGFVIFYRNHGKTSGFNLRELSDRGIDNYAAFVSDINAHKQGLNLGAGDVELLVRPYAVFIIDAADRRDDNGIVMRFGESAGKGYKERLQEPLVAEYLASSDMVRQAFAKKLQLHAVYGHFLGDIFDALDHVPEPQEMFDRMVGAMVSPEYDLARLEKESRAQGRSLKPYLGPRSSAILETARPNPLNL